MTIDEIEEALEAISNLSRATGVDEIAFFATLQFHMEQKDYHEVMDLWRANR